MADALIIVDVQYDFLPGGSLPVPLGEQVIPVLNKYLEVADAARIPIFASRDWHPPHTIHFGADGGTWPVHCVQGSNGAEFHKDLVLPSSTRIVTKGDNRNDDGYSAFDGRLADGQDLAAALSASHVDRVFVGGLATDYCVMRTVEDARRAGFEAVYLRDACRAVEVERGDGVRAEQRMLTAGARACTFEQFNPSPAS
jgi:nicotinamidase/pyrazinamidase